MVVYLFIKYLRNISNGFSSRESREVSLNGDKHVNYNSIDKSENLTYETFTSI